MKQFKSYSSMATVCAMLTLASCGNDIELTQVPVKGEYKVTFTASQEGSATRTAVDGSNVVWQTGDAITVFDGGGNNCMFELATGAGATVGEFVGTIQTLDPKSYCAVYPAMESATIDSDYGISGLSLPIEQVATSGSFDPRAAIMTARNDNADKITSTTEDLTLGEFKHVCAFVKVTTTEEYDKITFTANGGEGIAGGFTVTLDENGISTVTPTADASTTVSLVPAIEGTKIAAGTYLIAILPGTLEHGFTMECITFGDADSQMSEIYRTYNGNTSVFSRHNVVNMGTVSTTNGWTAFTPTYVDLGLTSGTKWATCNVGATSPEGYGGYFAWGETSPKNDYSRETYKWCEGLTYTKYNTTDGKTLLDASDDAAYINWGSAWRMPTQAEIEELLRGCYWEWTDNYGNTNTNNSVAGFIVYKAKDPDDKGKIKFDYDDTTTQGTYNSSADTHIFLPATGYHYGTDLHSAGGNGYYWSTSLRESPHSAWNVFFYSGDIGYDGGGRDVGRCVRPVLQ